MAYRLWKGSLEASDVVSGAFADALITASSITQHVEALEGVLTIGNLQPSSIDMGLHVIRLSANPTADNHAARKAYVDAADIAINQRLSQIEGGMVAGVVWKAAFATLVELQSQVGPEDVALGWAYYITSEKDIYVVVEGEGDYQPDGWAEFDRGFLKIADFAELSNLVATEQNRAVAAEQAIQSDLDGYRTSNNAALQTETNRATEAEGANASAIEAEATARAAAISAEASLRQSADTTAANDRTAIRELISSADAGLQAQINALALTESTNHDAQASAISSLDSSLSASIAAESSARESGDSANAAAINNEKIRAQAAEATLEDAIAAETGARQTEALELSQAIQGETDRAVAVENTLQAAINNETNRATAAEDALSVALENETIARTAAISGEAASRASAVALLQSSINDILSNTDQDALDSLSEIVEAFQGADATLTQAITSALGTHTSELAAEAQIRENADIANTNAINNEVARASSAEAALSQDISDEASARASADAALSGQLAAETTRATGAEVGLGNSISALQSTLEAAIASEAEARQNSDIEIRDSLRGVDGAGETTGATIEGVNENLNNYMDSHQIGVQVQGYDKTLQALADVYHSDDGAYSPVYFGDDYNQASYFNTAFDLTDSGIDISDPTSVDLTPIAAALNDVWPGTDFTSVDLSGNNEYGQAILAYFPEYVEFYWVFGEPTGQLSGPTPDGEANSVFYRPDGQFYLPIMEPVGHLYVSSGAYDMTSEYPNKYNLIRVSQVQGLTNVDILLAPPVREGSQAIFKMDALIGLDGQQVTVTLDAGAGYGIDGQQQRVMTSPYSNIVLLASNGTWHVVG